MGVVMPPTQIYQMSIRKKIKMTLSNPNRKRCNTRHSKLGKPSGMVEE